MNAEQCINSWRFANYIYIHRQNIITRLFHLYKNSRHYYEPRPGLLIFASFWSPKSWIAVLLIWHTCISENWSRCANYPRTNNAHKKFRNEPTLLINISMNLITNISAYFCKEIYHLHVRMIVPIYLNRQSRQAILWPRNIGS